MQSEAVQSRDSNRKQLILYALGFILLAYLSIISTDDLISGLCVFLCYIPLFLFARYLHRHGGMGWSWPN